ncbi:hypothetical protein EVAR_102102_1 [Eumeta japonica]|uniref:Uncharacterized protein n=1 Tax=Eumeta variegata TaxID=151549 RepID=A0A4C1U0H2_EUMVA|nr:hypothetical protein EVAR_102102_1 [Eumeta japonica]
MKRERCGQQWTVLGRYSQQGMLRERYVSGEMRKPTTVQIAKLCRSELPENNAVRSLTSFSRGAARMDIEQILSSLTSTDHSVDHSPDVVPCLDLSPGSAFDSDSGPEQDSVSFQNIPNSPVTPFAWTYNEFFDLSYQFMTSQTVIPMLKVAERTGKWGPGGTTRADALLAVRIVPPPRRAILQSFSFILKGSNFDVEVSRTFHGRSKTDNDFCRGQRLNLLSMITGLELSPPRRSGAGRALLAAPPPPGSTAKGLSAATNRP